MTDNRKPINLSDLPVDMQGLLLQLMEHLATLDADERRRFLDELIQEMEAITAQAGEVQP